MKKLFILLALLPLFSCGQNDDTKADGDFSGFTYPNVVFQNWAAATSGGITFDRLVPEPEKFIREHILDVVKVLYYSSSDTNIPDAGTIMMVIDPQYSGVAQKEGLPGGGKGSLLRFSPTMMEQGNTDEKKLLEIGGVLNHELTHIYQREPQGAGTYDGSSAFWAFIEGVADAVRPILGPFADGATAVSGGSWMTGYRTTGWFLVWLRDKKDPNFIRKFNATALSINPWSWDAAMQSIFGPSVTTQSLWNEYQTTFE